MALLFDEIKPLPQLHVLLIAVGGYPYLKDGPHEKDQYFSGAANLGQLTSPSVSAEEMYSAIIQLHQDNAWITPLGSIDVLVSCAQQAKPVFAGMTPGNATIANINQAYYDWKARCDTHEDNIALFFFCGHGLEKGEHYLLAEDFGVNPHNPWPQSFSFESTRRAFYTCKAKTQLFFVDACRYVTSDMLTHDIPPTPLEIPSFRSTSCKYDLVQKAAAPNEGAYGEKNKASFFTRALTGALKGNVAEKESGVWKVGTAKLAGKMNELLGEVMPGQDYPQRCISSTSDVRDIIQLKGPPQALLNVTCDPEQAIAAAALSCKNAKTAKEVKRAPEPQPWNIKVEAGVYSVKASFANGAFSDYEEYIPVNPPVTREKIRCV